MEAAFDLVATMSASCAQHYEDGLTPKAVTALQFSQGEIVAYCMCSTKLVAQNLEDADFRNLEENGYISALARFLDRCLEIEVWDRRLSRARVRCRRRAERGASDRNRAERFRQRRNCFSRRPDPSAKI